MENQIKINFVITKYSNKFIGNIESETNKDLKKLPSYESKDFLSVFKGLNDTIMYHFKTQEDTAVIDKVEELSQEFNEDQLHILTKNLVSKVGFLRCFYMCVFKQK